MAKGRRRLHRKSRLGCDVCKRRHIKCDERRPVCTNCEVSQRQCVFQDLTPQATTIDGSLPLPAVPAALAVTPTQQPTPASIRDDHFSPENAEAGPIIDMVHAELLIHYTFSVAVPGFEPDLEKAATSLVHRQALTYPWLMYAVLAISARHLAANELHRPKNSTQKYHDHSAALQTKALSLFNADMKSIDIHNCTAAVLFASIVGRHLLADTLGYLTHPSSMNAAAPDLGIFLERYDHYVNVHRGMRTIVSEAMTLLPHTESWPLMMWCGLGTTQESKITAEHRMHENNSDSATADTQLATLRSWIQTCATSSPATSFPTVGENSNHEDIPTVCLQAIDTLATGFRDMEIHSTPFRRHQVAVIWAVLCPPAFQELLRRRCPQALVVLAYYGVVLHHARGLWQVAGAGPPLVRMVAEYLGPEYGEQMAWPLAAVG